MTQNPLYEGLKINYLNIVRTTEEGAGIIRFSTLLTWASLIKKTNMRAADVGIVYYLVKNIGVVGVIINSHVVLDSLFAS